MGSKLDEAVDELSETDPYGAAQVADLSNGVLIALRDVVAEEIAKRLADCQPLMAAAAPKRTRTPKVTK